MEHDPLIAMLNRLKLTAIRDQLDSLVDEAAQRDLTIREALSLFCEREISRKDERRIEMSVGLAPFPFVRDLDQGEIDLVIASANGTFVDQAECEALRAVVPNAFVYTAKPALGESVGAAGLWQIILAAQALRSAELPPVLHAGSAVSLRLPLSRTPIARARHAIVLSCGLNQQAAGLRLAIR